MWEEDTDDKVRRNLVAASSAVLAAGWLQWDASKLLEKVVGGSSQAEAWQVWVVILVVLAYLVLRFQHTALPKWRNLLADIENDWSARERSAILNAGEHPTTGLPVAFGQSFLDAENRARAAIQEPKDWVPPVRPKYDYREVRASSQTATVAFKWPNHSIQDARLTYSLPRRTRWQARAASIKHHLLNTPYLVTLVIPCILSLSAVAVAAFKTVPQ